MKRKLIYLLLLLPLMVVFSGCAKDNSGGNTVSRDSFLGKWSVVENWTKLTYEVSITSDPNSADGVFIHQFAGTSSSSVPASAAVSGSSIVLDANQVIGDGLTINGSGTLSGTKITWSYTLDDGANQIHAIAVYTKL